ncbi:MAG: hypothetical protein HA494_03170 [Thaumarchaeota archaeon]|nr:hypothetical protein [Nitrososphaerota archaeon]
MGGRWVWRATLRRKTLAILLHSLEIPLAMVGAYMLGKGELLLSLVLVCAAVLAEAAYNWLKPYWEQP